MKVKKIHTGVYKVVDSSTWIAKGGLATMNGKWTAYDCENHEDCLTENNWGIQFDTFKQLKEYVEYWSKKTNN